MKRGGLGGAILLAAAIAVALVVFDRTPPPARAPATPRQEPLPPVPPDLATPEEPVRPAALLSGRVTDEQGHPIAGAEILLDGKTVARTGEDGAYVVEGTERAVLLGATARGFLPAVLPVVDGPIDFTLRRGGGALTLVIRVEDGKDPEVVVTVEPFFKRATGERSVVVQGGATVEGLVPEWNRVRVLAPGYAPVFLPVRLHPGGPVEASVLLERGATLVGTVRTENGAPVPGATVWSVAWGSRCVATADDLGAYRIEHLPVGRLDMEAKGAGGSAWAFLDFENGKESRWDPVLRPAGVISGRVVEEDGSPVAHAAMHCSFSFANEGQFSEGRTDADGSFRFADCRDIRNVLSVWRPGSKLPAAEVFASPSDSPLTITLPPAEGYVRGTVVDRNGAPAAGATIRVWPETRPDREVRARAAADGSFRVGPLPPGPYLAELHADGEPTRHLRPAFRIVAGETLDLGVVRFPVGGRIRASVVDMAGGVLPHEKIEILALDGSITFAGERDGGILLSEELTPGDYLVRAAERGLLEEVSVVADGVAPVELRLRTGGKLTFRPVLADGQPVLAAIRIENMKGRVLHDYDYDPTVFVTEGEWRIRAVDGRGRRAEVTVRVGPEDQAVVLVVE